MDSSDFTNISQSLGGEEAATLDDMTDGPAYPDEDGAWQSHVHEFLHSTAMAGECPDTHNHRCAGVTGEAIYVPGSHVHRIEARSDFHGHFHDIRLVSGPATFLLDSGARKSDRKHVHFIEGFTLRAGGHRHALEFATLIEAPLQEEDSSLRD